MYKSTRPFSILKRPDDYVVITIIVLVRGYRNDIITRIVIGYNICRNDIALISRETGIVGIALLTHRKINKNNPCPADDSSAARHSLREHLFAITCYTQLYILYTYIDFPCHRRLLRYINFRCAILPAYNRYRFAAKSDGRKKKNVYYNVGI